MKVTENYLWLLLDQGRIKVGITKKAQKEIGEIVNIHFPKKGERVYKKDPLIVLESTKSAIDIDAPISGDICEINPLLLLSLDPLNHSCEDQGWLVTFIPLQVEQYHLFDNYLMEKLPS